MFKFSILIFFVFFVIIIICFVFHVVDLDTEGGVNDFVVVEFLSVVSKENDRKRER